jgi:hypothetical protein
LPEITLPVEGLTVRYPSADYRHLLASKRVEDGDPAAENYLWRVISLETGERVAEAHHQVPGAWFFIWGDRLIHEARPQGHLVGDRWVGAPLRLRAIDLKTGAEVWTRPYRDTAYRGPYPPLPPAVPRSGGRTNLQSMQESKGGKHAHAWPRAR